MTDRIPDLEVDTLIVKDKIVFGDACKLYLSKGTSGINDRLAIEFLKEGAEIEIIPAPSFSKVSRIINQIQFHGRLRTTNGKQWRKRGSLTIWNDGGGGEAFYIESSLTGDAPDDGSETAMPMVFRMDEMLHGKASMFDVIFHPSDKSIELRKQLGDLINSARKTIEQYIDKLK
jgi:hypothetical protein